MEVEDCNLTAAKFLGHVINKKFFEESGEVFVNQTGGILELFDMFTNLEIVIQLIEQLGKHNVKFESNGSGNWLSWIHGDPCCTHWMGFEESLVLLLKRL